MSAATRPTRFRPAPFRSFFSRLSFLFLAMILALGGSSLLIAFRASRHLFDEVEQLLNREYAGSIAEELKPLVADGFSKDKIGSAIHLMMVLNPMVEIYLLDPAGAILAFFAAPPETLARNRIDVAPLDEFIGKKGFVPIYGDDPRSREAKKPFSAARLPMAGDSGYVYVILRGQGFDRSLAAVSSDYYLRSAFATFLAALAATAALGLILFFLLTKPLQRLAAAAKSFERGDYRFRIPAPGKDEIGDLSRAFNDMAASVEESVGKLKATEKQRSDLMANVSHDLRSPLASLRGHLETVMMKDGELDPERRRAFLETALRNAASLQKLVEELFDLAKLEARQYRLETERFPLAELVQDVVLKRKAVADAKAVTLDYRPEEGIPPIEGDIALIERALTNVLDNAVAFSPAGGEITVAVARGGGSQTVVVRDRGPGIDPEDLPRIFERFYRADKSRGRDGEGTGLGLAIAKEIAELHGGRILAENNPDGGASFRISLPEK